MRNAQRVIFFFLFCVALGGVATFLTQKGSAPEPIRLGFVSSLSGRASTAGIHARNGAMLAVEEANKLGGINGRLIELIVKDDKATAETAIKVDQELIDAGVVAIVGHLLSSMSVATVPLMNKSNTLMVASASSTSQLTGLDDNFIRLLSPVDKEADLLAEVAYTQLTLRKIVIAYDLSNSDLSESFQKFFSHGFGKRGGIIAKAISFNTNTKFSATDLASEINRFEPDGVFIVTNAIYAALLCQHLRKINQVATIIDSSWGFTDPAFIQNGGRAVEGVYSIAAFNAECQNPEFIKIQDELQKRFSVKPSLAMQLAYESVQVLLESLRNSKKPHDLKQTILSKKTFTGIDGEPIVFDQWGDPDRVYYLLNVKDAMIHTICKINPNCIKSSL